MLKKMVLILNVAVFLFCLYGCSATRNLFNSEVQEIIENKPNNQPVLITEDDLNNLPSPMKRYMHYIGIVGKPRIEFARVKQSGLFLTEPKSSWKRLRAEEYYYVNSPSFIWHGYIEVAPFLNAEARDKYQNGRGNMLIKMEPFITITDGKTAEYDIGSFARYFSEFVFIPTAFLEKNVFWEYIDEYSVKGTLKDSGLVTSAIFQFNDKGEIINFISEDKNAVIKGKTIKAKWMTPMRNYKEFGGIKVPTEGEGIFKLSDGDYEYVRIKIDNIIYNDYKMYE